MKPLKKILNSGTELELLRTKDNQISVDIVPSIANCVCFPHCDFSVVELPTDVADCRSLFQTLYDSQRQNHICLVTVRQPRKLRLATIRNITVVEEVGFKFHDTISIVSQDAYKCVPSNLTPLGEVAFLFTKGNDLNKEASSWFHAEKGDCTNVWDVTPQENELTFKDATVSRHFCLEIGAVLGSLASPLLSRRFLVVGNLENGHAEYSRRFGMSIRAFTEDELSAKRVIRYYNGTLCEDVQPILENKRG